MALNKPDPANPTQSLFQPIDDLLGRKFEQYQTQWQPRQMDQDGQVNGSQVWVQMIDMNADGRIDLVAAHETLNSWVVYSQQAGPAGPEPHRFTRHEIDIRPLLQYLPTSGAIDQSADGVFLPLSSTVTGHDQQFNHCWRRRGTGWIEVNVSLARVPYACGRAD